MFFPKLSALFFLATSSAAALVYKGADWSSVAVEERAGIQYKATADSLVTPLEQILVDNGMNIVRQRLWVVDGDADYGLSYNLALAARAQAVGLGVHVNMHFSNDWADPGNQAIPPGWPTDIDNLDWQLYNYTLGVSNAFAAAGITPVIMDIGNEISNGLLWPVGALSNFGNIARLLHSAARGIKDSLLDPKPKILIHLNSAADWSLQDYFYSNLLAAGPFASTDFDIQGVAYYPFYGPQHTLANLNTSLTNLAAKYNKEIFMAEINWPTSCSSPAQAFPPDTLDISISPGGQVEFLTRTADIMANVEGANGMEYWEPAWVDNQSLGSSCESNTLFSWPGVGLSSLTVFQTL